MISIDEAFRTYDDAVSPLPGRDTPVRAAVGRVLSAAVSATTDLPPFPQSAMDGYALRAEDTRDATSDDPARLRLTGVVPAGAAEDPPDLEPGTALRIFTGAPIPAGADAVLRQEDARVEDEALFVSDPVPGGDNVRDRGEDLRDGTELAPPGTRVTPGHVTAFAGAGVESLRARPGPRITVLVTGDEVIPPGRPLRRGEVYDANSYLVGSWLASRGYASVEAGHLPDRPDATRERLDRALEASDLVLTTGGVSVGDRDFVLDAAADVGVDRKFWRVAQKPGKPLYFGIRDEAVLLGLPGNPGSVHACLMTHARRVLDRLEGQEPVGPRYRPGRLRRPAPLRPQREWWVRCRIEVDPPGQVWLVPLPDQGSHMIAGLGRCHALARLPTGEGEAGEGTSVRWVPAAGMPAAGI